MSGSCRLSTAFDRLVHVDGRLKLGNFTLAFTDLTIPVAGIPITITRTYDTSRAGDQGDFGYGWQVGFGSVDVKVDVAHGPALTTHCGRASGSLPKRGGGSVWRDCSRESVASAFRVPAATTLLYPNGLLFGQLARHAIAHAKDEQFQFCIPGKLIVKRIRNLSGVQLRHSITSQ